MAKRVLSNDLWHKLGQPDLNHKMYYIHGVTKKRVYGIITEIDYGHKKGVAVTIKPFKNQKLSL
jgi:hypothetical protein